MQRKSIILPTEPDLLIDLTLNKYLYLFLNLLFKEFNHLLAFKNVVKGLRGEYILPKSIYYFPVIFAKKHSKH
jgi:hypothetical protein